ncbi:MAG: DUF1501 domain-containing protein [Gomphosphaeria aponina SAG 52.96 = DSM 107014]|uniref:DUF1501 domain-containing protein n=1 Tax=Gomphosphaeria aponina SAG 52.96 = DSM 107014 TaxID=1521640 RepID=A0A941GM40_9CHRO|nr:DUF1501 domain-containing protein [Gomphosphaeria aponina SAG 52.96 = DSM 107014]
MKRRKLLQYAGLLTAASLIPIGMNGWAFRSVAQTNNPKRLIVIFLRGGVDGLNVVVPHQEADYYEARPSIALPKPGEKDGVLDLDGQFGLNPALKDIMPLWKQGSLAFVHACGSPDFTRSHFDAQDYMETGTPGVKKTQDGWMNRLLAVLPQGEITQAINLGDTPPRILMGKMPVTQLATGKKGTVPLPLDQPQINEAFDRLYSGNDPVSLAYQEGDQARQILLADLTSEMKEANKGDPLPDNFASDARRLAKLMVGDARTQLGFIGLGGWDSHVNENALLTRLLLPLGEGLAALAQELGPLYSDTVIMVISEFGRTVGENGNNGTDHGHGNVMWVLGGGIRGTQVYGAWPGLAESQLYESRDLAITTDFRDAIAPVLTQHLQISPAQLSQVFPGYTFQTSPNFLG